MGGALLLLVPATFDDIKEAQSIIFVAFSVKFGLIKLDFLIFVIFWRVDIVLLSDPQKVCIVV